MTSRYVPRFGEGPRYRVRLLTGRFNTGIARRYFHASSFFITSPQEPHICPHAVARLQPYFASVSLPASPKPSLVSHLSTPLAYCVFPHRYSPTCVFPCLACGLAGLTSRFESEMQPAPPPRRPNTLCQTHPRSPRADRRPTAQRKHQRRINSAVQMAR